jgi:hypothetical protein
MNLFYTLCTPAKLYLILLIPGIISFIYNKSIGKLVVTLIWAPIWAYLLNWLCSKGYSGVSWFFVLIPVIVMIIFGIIYAGTLVKK